jgi:hypothetical protein
MPPGFMGNGIVARDAGTAAKTEAAGSHQFIISKAWFSPGKDDDTVGLIETGSVIFIAPE